MNWTANIRNLWNFMLTNILRIYIILSVRAWSHCGRFFRLSSSSAAFRDRRQGYCRGMRPILVAAARIDNLPKEADYRFCVKLRQRQARHLLQDAHCSERVKKQVVQFHLSLLEKETCSDWKRFRKGSWSSGFRSSWRNNPVVWSLSLDFQRSLQNVGRRRRLHLLLS